MEYGYISVSSRDQNEDRQMDALLGLGLCRKNIFMDRQSGKDFNREQYKKLVRRIREDALTATWTVSGAASYSTVAAYGDYLFVYDGSLSSGDSFTVSNQVDAAMHYTWSGVQTDSAETEDTVTVAEGTILLDKTFTGLYGYDPPRVYFGSEAPFTLTLTPPGVASMALGDVSDTLPVAFYIPADGIEGFF